MINYKGPGEHSVKELEAIIAEREELLSQKQLILQNFRKALTTVSQWELPASGIYWGDSLKTPMSYESAFGSNGVRYYMKNIAAESLNFEKNIH